MVYAFAMRASDWAVNKMSVRLKRARLRSGLGQVELADQLGVDQSTVSRVERGGRPRYKLLKLIEQFVNESERQSRSETERIAEAVARSEEFKALVARIAAEL